MKLISCKFSLNYRIPVIIDNSNTPSLLPFTYTVLSMSTNAFNTKRNHLHPILSLYRFFNAKEINLEKLIIAGKFELIVNSLDEFILKTEIHRFPDRLQAIEKFLIWAIKRYNKNTNSIEEIVSLKLEAYLKYKKSPRNNKYKSLIDSEVCSLRDISDVLNSDNPFSREYRYRNKLIIELFLETGIRLGELLKLKVNDFARIEDRYYMKIDNHSCDFEDNRRELPSNKNINSFRSVALSSSLYIMVQEYILNYRRFLKRKQKMKLNHSYLFVSERGNPMSSRAIQLIFENLQEYIRNTNKSQSDISITAHSLRHTFADRFLKFLTENGIDMERAKDELRIICGWNPSSSMPVRYSIRYISKIANDHNLKRITESTKNK